MAGMIEYDDIMTFRRIMRFAAEQGMTWERMVQVKAEVEDFEAWQEMKYRPNHTGFQKFDDRDVPT